MIVVFLIILFNILSNVNGVELPSYIPKCSISDPNLNECIKENANLIIPIVAKGDIEFGIPSLSPVIFNEAPCRGENISFVLYHTYHDNIKDMRLNSADFDLENGKLTFNGHLDIIQVLAENYTILSGKFINITASGHGRFNMTIEKVAMEYKADISKYVKNGDIYMELTNSEVFITIGHSYFYFENLESQDRDDVNAYINQNWKIFEAQLKPVMNRYLNTFFSYTLNVIFNKVPLCEMFLP